MKLLIDFADYRGMKRPPRTRPRARSSLQTIVVVAAFLALGLFVNEEYFDQAAARGTAGGATSCAKRRAQRR